MKKVVVVHTGATPDMPLRQERESLDAPDIDLRLLGIAKTPAEVLAAVRDADVSICMGEPYTREVFAGAPRLKLVMRYGVGVDTIDLDAATEMGVIVGHLPDFCTREVANQALALLLVCARKTLQLDHALRTAGWKAAKAMQSPMGSVHGETLGIIGLGRIGQALARRALALDMKIIACDPYVGSSVFATAGVQAVGLNDLARRADYVSCHVPLTGETRDMINARFFALMKPTAYFINTSRGAVVNELDLIAALQEKRIAGAGLDVFAEEPIAPTHPLCLLDNVVLSPHNASYADQTKIVQQRRVGTDVLAFCRGGLPQFVANPDVLSHRRA